jgi:glycosyltransferase involved in cell wall biosynthesis
MNETRLSAVITAYNSAAFVAEALESVLAQTCPPDEIIVVDDGSTDETPSIVAGFQTRSVRYVYQANQGAGAARNRGILETHGELLAFLDADDLWLAEKCRLQKETLVANPQVALVSGWAWWWDVSSGQRWLEMRAPYDQARGRREILIHNWIGNPSMVMLRRSILEQVGLFDAKLRWGQDWELWIRMIRSHPVAVLPEPMIIYRSHPENLSHSRRWERLDCLWEISQQAITAPEGCIPAWQRPCLWARAWSHATFQRGMLATRSELPWRRRVAYALVALLAYPFENGGDKLRLFGRALIGEPIYRWIRRGFKKLKPAPGPTQTLVSGQIVQAEAKSTPPTAARLSPDGKKKLAGELRVAHVIDTLKIGGAQRLLTTFASQARNRRISTTVISLRQDPDPTIPQALQNAGAQVVIFSAGRLLDLRRFRRLVRFLKAGEFDVLQTHLTYANILGAAAARLAGIPSVATLHSTGELYPPGDLYPPSLAQSRGYPPQTPRPARSKKTIIQALERIALRSLTQQIVAVGHTVAEVYRPALKPRPVVVVPNGVDIPPALPSTERAALRQEIAGDAARPIIIAVGRFIPAKAYHVLVEAFARVHAACPDATLVIVGDGPLLPSLQEQVRSLGLADHIYLPGARQDIQRWLAAADIYVSSSHWEGLPLSVLEGMMAGLPVVATDVGDLPRILKPEFGLVVPVALPAALPAAMPAWPVSNPDQDSPRGFAPSASAERPGQLPERLAEALISLLADPARRQGMGEAARQAAMRDYTASAWMDRLLALYASVFTERLTASAAQELTGE